jgi:hypothetical protein
MLALLTPRLMDGFQGALLGIGLALAGIGLLVHAFAAPQIAWRFFWPGFLKVFGRSLSCEITPAGIRLKPGIDPIQWKYFIAVKYSDSLILLYLDRAFAFPIHRSMLGGAVEWAELNALVRRSVRRRFW